MLCSLKGFTTTLIVLSAFVCTPSIAEEDGKGGEVSGQALLDEQKAKLEKLGVDMNQTGKALYDTFTSKPQKVKESGCLDSIRAINANAIVIDPMNVLSAVYSKLKDELVNSGCSAATDYANELSGLLAQKLELPYGIASLDISTSGSATGDNGVFNPDVKLDNEKVANEISNSVVKDARSNSYSAKSGLQMKGTIKRTKSTKSPNTKDAEKAIENAIDVDKFWGGSNEEGKENEGNENQGNGGN
ncbi:MULTISPECIES: hypothetical protein [Pseudoalteromonas]|uniref:hypothetical protein n=1 Tax=Pseudoalteromonas TaxID=53246 RepID=UPI0015837B2D|nr:MULTISPECIES: hypothetical protein [Pseudoalteromonas]MDI4652579.1 hypothetical protein [Pseudoalteromonas shioyasakiensis]NUJ38713.1 hypothetical protein [Pseudoalteromonas sp. 0303]